MNNLIKKIVESKFNFNIDIEDNKRLNLLSKSKYNSMSLKELYKLNQYVVDLGLPSGTLWTKWNLGASKPEEPGNYYAWGEIEPKQKYTWDNYKFIHLNELTKYNEKDKLTELLPEDDAAYQSDHRMKIPSKEQIEELIGNTELKWIKDYNGVEGGLFVGKNGNEMFVPITGRYFSSEICHNNTVYLWSSSLDLNDPNGAHCLSFELYLDYDNNKYFTRRHGTCIRPIFIN